MGRKYVRRSKRVICNFPGCNRVTEDQYCTEHVYKPPARNAPRDKFLNTAAWTGMSTAKLNETPWCEECAKAGKTAPAEDVDHILPRKTHPHLALAWSNLQSLCLPCHCRKTRMGL